MSQGNGTTSVHFTATEARMMGVLADGRSHHRSELQKCLFDDLGSPRNVHPHLSSIRKKLKARGEGILCEYVHRRICYRYVRFVASATE